jgi:hypothetical protein
MANATQALVRMPERFGGAEVKFGKGDKVLKIATGPAEAPTGILFLGRDGSHYHADISRYPDGIKAFTHFHGAKQKLGDEYADLDDIADCLEAVRELDGRLASGRWTAERQGFAGISLLMRAIMEVFGLAEEKAREFLKPLSAKEKQGLRQAPELKAVIDRMEAERGKSVDVGGLLGKLKAQA